MKTTLVSRHVALGCLFASLVTTASVADAGHVAVSAQADVRVWIEGGDVFADYADVAIWLRPERDCYTTLFMVDTDGFMHVLYPSSPYDDTWLYGGRSYCYRARDLGLDRLDGAGIAYIYAVASPVPFDYSAYGAGIFVGGFGFRVYGDPFVACRDFYMTLLPSGCRWDYVGVSYARFYVRHWQRYPSYLCYGGPGIHVRVGDGCRSCGEVYVSYRRSCERPWDAFRPVTKFKHAYARGGVHRDGGWNDRDDRWNDDRGHGRASRIERVQREGFKAKGASQAARREYTVKQVTKPSSRWNDGAITVESRKPARTKAPAVSVTPKRAERARVVSTSSARGRASVDRADVAAMKRPAARAKVWRPNDSPGKGTAHKAARAETSREKGSKKKQAR